MCDPVSNVDQIVNDVGLYSYFPHTNLYLLWEELWYDKMMISMTSATTDFSSPLKAIA